MILHKPYLLSVTENKSRIMFATLETVAIKKNTVNLQLIYIVEETVSNSFATWFTCTVKSERPVSHFPFFLNPRSKTIHFRPAAPVPFEFKAQTHPPLPATSL